MGVGGGGGSCRKDWRQACAGWCTEAQRRSRSPDEGDIFVQKREDRSPHGLLLCGRAPFALVGRTWVGIAVLKAHVLEIILCGEERTWFYSVSPCRRATGMGSSTDHGPSDCKSDSSGEPQPCRSRPYNSEVPGDLGDGGHERVAWGLEVKGQPISTLVSVSQPV